MGKQGMAVGQVGVWSSNAMSGEVPRRNPPHHASGCSREWGESVALLLTPNPPAPSDLPHAHRSTALP